MSEQIVTKRCSTCKQIKPIFEFYKNRSSSDGFQSVCKACQKTYNKSEARLAYFQRYEKTDKCKDRRKFYAKTAKGRISTKNRGNRYKASFPERRKAKDAVNYQIRHKGFPRANTKKCHRCDNQAQQYHHHKGYAKKHWLDVIPVCIPCHKKLDSI